MGESVRPADSAMLIGRLVFRQFMGPLSQGGIFPSSMTTKLLLVVLAFVSYAHASSHSEAPGTAASPSSDLTDFYMFQCYEPGRQNYTCFIMNANPLQEPYGGPNYFSLSDSHFFEIYIDNNGDAREDLTFQFFAGNNLGGPLNDVPLTADDDCNIYTRSLSPTALTVKKHTGIEIMVGGQMIAIPLKFIGPISKVYDPNLNWFEYYHLNVIRGDRSFGVREPVSVAGNSSLTQFPKPFDYAGNKTFANYSKYAMDHIREISIPGCNGTGRVFVGQRREAFKASLGAIFDLINFVPLSGYVKETDANDDLAGLNVDSFVLEVPHKVPCR